MRKIVVSEFLSLDGVMEEPSWTAPYRSDESSKFKAGELFGAGALLLGRVTYQDFAAGWPAMQDAFADRMNGLPKYVVSTTLQEAEWNNSSIIKEDVAEEIGKLKAQPGQDILVYGSGELVRSLLRRGLVDQLNLLIYPVVLGGGKRLFGDGEKTTLKLAETQTFGSGVVRLTYRPSPPEAVTSP